MNVVGYTDLLSVEPGDTLRVMVSCALDEYRADLVRLIHGDPNPDGPGVNEEEVPSAIDGPHPGREQSFPRGSCVMVPDSPLLRLTGSFTVRAYVQSTTPGKGVQGLVTKWSGDDGGYGLFIGDDGSPSLWIGDGAGGVERLSTGVPLVEGQWYILTASFDSSSRRVTLHQRQTAMWAMDEYAASVERETSSRGPAENDAPLIVAGCADGLAVRNHFNGRIEAPRLWNRAVPPEEADAVTENGLVAAWDFAEDTSSARIADVSGNRLDGTALNMPTRAVTGHGWQGRESDFRRAPDQYGAIHFHDDDLEDARWEPDFELTVPDDVRSAVYAVRLRAGSGPGSESYAPFFVRPKRGGPTVPILFLAPTNTYIAYADTHAISHPSTRARYERMGIVMPEDYPWLPEDRYVIDQELLSLYDRHSDDSGVCYSTRLRPILNLNPKYRGMGSDQKTMGPHILGADLHLLDWMEVKGFDYDVLTDQDLHFEGAGALAPYRVVLTGTHPEYWTERMLDGLEEYLASGGRLMYLGGNGFYWVTSLDPERPHVIEIRRWGGTGPWKAQAGEYHHSTTGELGGVWRSRGRAPQRTTGVGFASQGSGPGIPYQRKPDSYRPEAAFIFEGVGDEPIGEGGLVMGGAAGFEVDRTDPALGTPPQTLTVATAWGLSDEYQHCVEELFSTDPRQGGSMSPDVRADMVYFKGPNGGGVFSVGSIAWCGSLSQSGYDNPVSKITGNVLRKFSSNEGLP